LAGGRIVCAGHFGADDPIREARTHQNYINLHAFRLKVNRRTKSTRIEVVRDYDQSARRWLNRYTLRLTEEWKPLAARWIEFWYAERYQPGYDSCGAAPLEERMKAGSILKVMTDGQGIAHVQLPSRFDESTNPHLSYQLVARYNMDRADPGYQPYETPQLEFYAHAPMPPPLKPKSGP
jgi:hypothetical protein